MIRKERFGAGECECAVQVVTDDYDGQIEIVDVLVVRHCGRHEED